VRWADGVVCVLRHASRAAVSVHLHHRVKAGIAVPVLRQPRVRPAPANPAVRLGAKLFDAGNSISGSLTYRGSPTSCLAVA